MSKGIISRADLLRFLANYPKEEHAALAALMGFEFSELPPPKAKEEIIEAGEGASSAEALPMIKKALQPATYWKMEHFTAVPSDEKGKKKDGLAIEKPIRPNTQAPRPHYRYLAEWAELEPRLRRALSQHRFAHRLDMDKLVKQISRGHIPHNLPHQQRRIWGECLQVIDDRNPHLAPYLTDYTMVQQRLSVLFPGEALEIALLDAASNEPVIHAADGLHAYTPPAGGRVLILSDLGLLAQDGGRLRRFWQAFGERLKAAECRATVLLPCSPKLCRGKLSHLYQLLCWEHPAPALPDAGQRESQMALLQRLLSPALYFQPGLLRAMRLSLGADAPDAAIESLLWQKNALNHAAAAVVENVQEQRAAFVEEEAHVGPALEHMRQWLFQPGAIADEIWYEMVNSLPEAVKQAHINPDEIRAAEDFYLYIAQCISSGERHFGPNALAWMGRTTQRLGEDARNNPKLKEALRTLEVAHGRAQAGEDVHEPPQQKTIAVWQQGDLLRFSVKGSDAALQAGSPLAELCSGDGLIELERMDSFWLNGDAPDWAEDWGWDEYGIWLEFVVKGVRQRMRWIAAGSFMMGSQEGEAGRFDGSGFFLNEGPQHRVTLTQGYWMFDTPVTQALWLAVMGENPSRFQDKHGPVENVSWDDAKLFFNQMNALKPGLDLALPSEAQWEYACRAGIEHARYGDDLVDLAWYGENSGGKTQSVKQKVANGWGMYDMLGNVWEWCEDAKGEYAAGEQSDPLARGGAGAERVFRGGSWLNGARFCRAICRGWGQPEVRGGNLGFRPARVQVSTSQVAEPGGWCWPEQKSQLRCLFLRTSRT